jgi:hypothetical protein
MKTQDQRDPSSKTQQSHALAGKFISSHKEEEEEEEEEQEQHADDDDETEIFLTLS